MNVSDEQLIALLEGESNAELEKELEHNPGLQKRYYELKEVLDAMSKSTSPELPAHIGEAVAQAVYDEQMRIQRGFSWYQLAAAVAILIIGFTLGRLGQSEGPDNTSELLALKNEISSLKEATLTSSLKQYSASDRIFAVNQIERSQEINAELLETLVTTLNSDESPNVRYAALQALTNFINQEQVRYALVKSLEGQTDPLIQIALITILVEAEEKSARVPMKKLIETEETLPEVKEQAEIALQVLI